MSDELVPYNMSDRTVQITLKRFNELQMLQNRNAILEAKVLELLEEIRSLKHEQCFSK